ncbi:MAG: glycosyltransferase [Candidatus Eisenbacteria bacterium]
MFSRARRRDRRSSRIVLVSNTSWYLHNFRASTIRRLVRENWDVTAVAPDERMRTELEALGARFVVWKFNRRSMSPLRNAGALGRLCWLYLTLRPDVVHHFTIKPIILGGVAARLTRVRGVVQSVTGLGLAFTSDGLRLRIAAAGYRLALGGNAVTIFQNKDDLRIFTSSGLVGPGRAMLIRGSGVDVDRLALTPEPDPGGDIVFLMACRMLWAKGVREFVEAARDVAAEHPECRFVLLGDPDSGTPDAVPRKWLEAVNEHPNIEWLGHQQDIQPFLGRAHVVVLPSYREGTPRTLLEAGAAGRALIATDVPGCRDVAVDGRAGLLVPKQDAAALKNAMITLATDPVLRGTLGSEARERVRTTFSEERVVGDTLAVYRSRLSPDSVPVRESPSPSAHETTGVADADAVWAGWNRELGIGRDSESMPSELPDYGALVVSLDLELHWGMRDRLSADGRYGRNLRGTRKAVEGILDIFDEFEIAATWATVGFLFAASLPELHECSPALKPTYLREGLSPYAESAGPDHFTDPVHFAADLIDLIRSAPNQEIGSHTFSHYYCLEDGQTAEQFGDDLRSAVLIAARKGIRLRSIALPRNQVNPDYHESLRRNGFECYRGHANGGASRGDGSVGFIRRVVRLADSYVNIGGHHTFRWSEIVEDRGLCNIPGSFFVRPSSGALNLSTRLQERRLCKAIEHAAGERELLHLWWHPHNFGADLDENLRMIRRVLGVYRDCNAGGRIRSMNMSGVAASVLSSEPSEGMPEWLRDPHYLSLRMETQLESS